MEAKTEGHRNEDRAGWFAVDFANTTACPSCQGQDALGSAATATRWVRQRLFENSVRLFPTDLPELRRFRESVRVLLGSVADGAEPPTAAIRAVNSASLRSPALPLIRRSRAGFSVADAGRDRRGSDWLEGAASRSLIDLLTRPRTQPIRRCAGPGCVHFLVAPSRQQRWCSPTGCGNRVRVQRHYRKIHSRGRGKPRMGHPPGPDNKS